MCSCLTARTTLGGRSSPDPLWDLSDQGLCKYPLIHSASPRVSEVEKYRLWTFKISKIILK